MLLAHIAKITAGSTNTIYVQSKYIFLHSFLFSVYSIIQRAVEIYNG